MSNTDKLSSDQEKRQEEGAGILQNLSVKQ